jgi:hypothetical protein
MPTNTETALLSRIDGLINRAKQIQKSETKRATGATTLTGEVVYERNYTPAQDCEAWRCNLIAVVEAVVARDSALWKRFENIHSLNKRTSMIDHGLAFLIALREDIELGLLRRSEQRIEAAVTVDYLDMAERLLQDDASPTHRHIPASVLAGAVFEHGLRALALRKGIETKKPDGEPLMLNGLIDALKRADVITELDAKSMRAWAGIRNAAAHGQFADVTEAKAKELIAGVTAFLAANQ